MLQSLLMMAPAVALALVLLLRPYVGERTISRLRASLSRFRRPSVASSCPPASSYWELVARGGRLISVALAGRAPPPAVAGCAD